MNKLRKVKFNELYKISSGISTSKEQYGRGFPFLSFREVFKNYFLPDKLANLLDTSIIEQEKFSIKKGDIFITRTSETLDELAMSSVVLKDYPRATFSGFLKRLRPINDEVYSKYIAFFLRSRYFRKAINNNTIMTLRASFNEDIFSFLDLYLPNYKEQVKIGDLLYNIEKKIQINTKINDNLEKQMKLLFDYWFIQFEFPNKNGKPYKSSGGKMYFNDKLKLEIPYTWNQCSLKEYANNIITGKTPPKNKESYFNGNIPFVTIPDLRDNLFIINTEQKLSEFVADYQKSKYLPKDSLCISCIATLGEFSFTTEVCQTNQQINSIIFKEKFIKEFTYFFLKNIFENLSVKTGNTFKNMNKEEFSQIKMLSPAKEVVYNFHRIANIIFKKIENNCFENKRLISLRDFLLPLLMNGQATISE